MCQLSLTVMNVLIALAASAFAFMAFEMYRARRTDWAKIYDHGYKDAILHYKLPGYETDTMRKRVDATVSQKENAR